MNISIYKISSIVCSHFIFYVYCMQGNTWDMWGTRVNFFLMDLAVSISSDPNENVSTILVVQFQAILSKSSFLNYLLASLCSEI